MRDMSTATDHKLKSLSDKLEVLGVKVEALGDRLSTVDTRFITMDGRFVTMGGRFDISNAKTQSNVDALRLELKDREVQFWARLFFPVSSLLCICYILPSNNAKAVVLASFTSTAAFLEYQNCAIQTPAV
jgi:hypothetical protein